jgi:hypothetical protein
MKLTAHASGSPASATSCCAGVSGRSMASPPARGTSTSGTRVDHEKAATAPPTTMTAALTITATPIRRRFPPEAMI